MQSQQSGGRSSHGIITFEGENFSTGYNYLSLDDIGNSVADFFTHQMKELLGVLD